MDVNLFRQKPLHLQDIFNGLPVDNSIPDCKAAIGMKRPGRRDEKHGKPMSLEYFFSLHNPMN